MKKVIFILCTIIMILTIFIFRNNYVYSEINDNTISVEIKGAINNPGVYKISNNNRVNDLIKKAGNLKNNADTSTINLSKKLEDEMVVIIYTKDEISEMRKGNTSIKYIERECTCPILENDACIEDVVSNNSINNKEGRVSLNTGTLDELMTLPGIGQSKAEAIIDYRKKNGGFKEIEDIKKIKGIGDAMYKKIKDYIML